MAQQPSDRLHYFAPGWIQPDHRTLKVDIAVYGATAGGVIAAVTAARQGRSVALLQPGLHVGGMTSGGLSWTDFGIKAAIGGESLRFYQRLGQHYGRDAEWHFEPHVAEKLLHTYLEEADVKPLFAQYLDRVEMQGQRLTAIVCLSGLRVEAKTFIDASYEGDLMAKAGVRYTVGREGNAAYGETLNGVQVRQYHQFEGVVDPYVEPGNPASGTLPWVSDQDAAVDGAGDHRVQAYCFRVCMTDNPDIRVAWPKPAGFDPAEFVLAARWYNAEKGQTNDSLQDGRIRKIDRLCVPWKTDTNNHGPVSSDYIGANYGWPEGDYAARERIFQQHVRYQQGFYWFMANDSSIPKRYQEIYQSFGLAGDEFVDTGHWPHQLYIREARRMVSDYVLTEHDCMGNQSCDDPVALGSYTMDSHNCQRFIRDGKVVNEGDVQVRLPGPYGIAYRSIVPARGQCENLIVPICLSASHIAYGSARMEPVFMILGETAALAAEISLSESCSVQDVPYAALRDELLKREHVLTAEQAKANAAAGEQV